MLRNWNVSQWRFETERWHAVAIGHFDVGRYGSRRLERAGSVLLDVWLLQRSKPIGE